ncbi:expressed unknown protein [Seminavis robusta]|uniref:RXYLT1 C-terminal domain-containing protein n=1 Tax=Seminavis robusta TaxID=568900 RepID=A0A9N8DU85_9STRA|nr:expressed unknown protein [Seminavis robusta]|eukprot:Sro283_g107770.1 n/a (517) ;mRNA; r:51447-52997
MTSRSPSSRSSLPATINTGSGSTPITTPASSLSLSLSTGSSQQKKKKVAVSGTFVVLCLCSFAVLFMEQHDVQRTTSTTTSSSSTTSTGGSTVDTIINATQTTMGDLAKDTQATHATPLATHATQDTPTSGSPAAAVNYTDLEYKFYQRHYEALRGTNKMDFMYFGFDSMEGLFQALPKNRWYKVSKKDLDHHIQKRQSVPHDHPTPLVGNNDVNRNIIFFRSKYESLCQATLLFNQYRALHPQKPWRHVLLFGFQQDLGGLSSEIPGETTDGRDVAKVWSKMGCSKQDIRTYLDHPDTLAAITSQFHYKWDHPKTHSIPLGFMNPSVVDAAYTVFRKLPSPHTLPAPITRRREILLSFSLKKQTRARAQQQLDFNFQNSTISTAQTWPEKDRKKASAKVEYFQLLAGSKFLLSPHGLGLDCYRTWEALFMGVCPIVETLGKKRMPDGWFRTLDDLPALVVESYAQVTPALLEQTYHDMLQQWDTYQWEKLTKHWWIHFILQFFIDNDDNNAATAV